MPRIKKQRRPSVVNIILQKLDMLEPILLQIPNRLHELEKRTMASYQTIPFDLKTTMKRDGGECIYKDMSGKVYKARIICTDKRGGGASPLCIVVLVSLSPNHETLESTMEDGRMSDTSIAHQYLYTLTEKDNNAK